MNTNTITFDDDAAEPSGLWSTIHALAWAIPAHVDLSIYEAVVRELFRAGFTAREFVHVYSEVVEVARENREASQR